MRFLIALGLALTSDVLRAAHFYELSEVAHGRARKMRRGRARG